MRGPPTTRKPDRCRPLAGIRRTLLLLPPLEIGTQAAAHLIDYAAPGLLRPQASTRASSMSRRLNPLTWSIGAPPNAWNAFRSLPAAEAIARDRALAVVNRAIHGDGEPRPKTRTIRRDDGTQEVVTESDPERLAVERARLGLEFPARCKIPFVSPAQAARFLKEFICVSDTAHRNISSNRICKPLASAARPRSPVVARNPFPGRPGRVAFWWR